MKKKFNKVKKKLSKEDSSSSSKEKKFARIIALFFFVFGVYFSLKETSITGNMVLSSDIFLGINLIGALLILISFILLIVLNKN